jgi:hypothetical protein
MQRCINPSPPTKPFRIILKFSTIMGAIYSIPAARMPTTPSATAPTKPFATPTALGAAPWKVTTGLVTVWLPELEGAATLAVLLLIGYGAEEAALVVAAGGAAAADVVAGGGAADEEELPPGLRTESTLGTVTPAFLQAKVA